MEIKVKENKNSMSTYTAICPYCKKELTQNYRVQALHNMEVHAASCKKNPKNKEEESNESSS
jgi:hypothetical protein